MKVKIPTFNDGVLYVCKPEAERSSFNAVRNPTVEADLEKIIKLDFDETSRRDQDLDFAESQGRSLNMKVKTRLRPEVTKHHQVLIGAMLYSIIYIDYNRDRGEMYLYLEEVRKLT